MTRARTRAPFIRLSLTGLTAAAAALAVSAAPAVAHGGDHADTEQMRAEFLAAPGDPALTSDNVSFLSAFPETTGISGDFSVSSEHFYTSSLDTLTVFDISDPKAPVIEGTLPNFVFENEAMNYGEQRTKSGELKSQFIMVGVDIVQASPGDPEFNIGGGELIIVDVSEPSTPTIVARVPGSTSTHTVACVKRVKCNFAYSAGDSGRYSIFDLRDITKPKEVDANPNKEGVQGFRSPASAPSSVFSGGAGHKWNYVGKGLAFHTGSLGTAAFDVSKPLKPRLLTTTNDVAGTPEKATPWNNFIHHNSWMPHAFKYKANAPAKLSNGNVLLVTEEDYENTNCETAGSFQTWRVGNLKNPKAITPLDKVELEDLGGPEQGIFPQGGFCSAHWFDYHQTGIVAAAYYNGGTRLLDVRDPKNIKSFGFVAGGGQTWDAYWVPKRDANKRALLSRTNIFYSVDAVRGLEVYEVTNMPGRRASQRAVGGRSAVTQPTSALDTSAGVVLPIGIVGAYVLTRNRRRRNAQTD
jgi:hypothetical protein